MLKLRQVIIAMAGFLLFVTLSLPAAAAPSFETATLAACPVPVKNGGFEATPIGANWTQGGNSGKQLVTNFNPRTGKNSAQLGGTVNTDHAIRQTLTLPHWPVTLTFWYEQWTQETAPSDEADYLIVYIAKADGSTPRQLARLGVDPERPPWQRVSLDLSPHAGETVQLQFVAHNDGSNPTDFFVDDVSIPGCRAYLPTMRR